MDYEYANWNNQSDYPKASPKPASPFADAPYEMPHQQQTDPAPVIGKRQKKTGNFGKRLLCVVLVAFFLVLGCGVTAICVNSYWNEKYELLNDVMDNKLSVLKEQLDSIHTNSGNTNAAPNQQGALTTGQVYAQNVQAVVAISNQSLTTNIYGQLSETASSGSGFVISENGYIVTNYHVVQGAKKLSVIMSDSKEYDAKLIGYDSSNDVAVLKIDAAQLPYVKLGSSDALVVGDQVMAIGNPLGELTSTLTVGYISAKDRAVNTDGTYMNMLQTDAAINSGNSGGPLFNTKGEVVGITTAKYSGTSSSGATIEGIGFAIPIDDVADIIEDLVKHGYVTGGYLGVMARDMDPDVSQVYGMPLGVYVVEVTAGSCAEAAGIQAKDIIVNLGGYDITSMSELSRALRKLKAGQTTTVTVYRGGAQQHMSITLDEKPQNTQTDTPASNQEATTPGNGTFDDWFGSFFPGFGG